MKTKKTIKMNIPDYWGVGKESLFKSIKIQPNKKLNSMIPKQGQFSWSKDFSLAEAKGQFSWTKDKAIPKKDMNYKQANQFFSLCPIGDTDKDGVPNWRDCRPYDSSRQGKHFDAFKKKVGGVKEKFQSSLTDFEKPPHPPPQTRLSDFPDVKKPDVRKPSGRKKPEAPLGDIDWIQSAETPGAPLEAPPKAKAKPKRRKPTGGKKVDASTFETSYTVEGEEPETEPTPDVPQLDWYMFVKFANRKWEQVAVLKQNQIKDAVEDFKRNFPNVEDVQVSQNLALLGKLNRKLAVQHGKEAISDYAERQQFKKHIGEGLKIKKDTDIQGLRRRMSGLESGMQRPARMPVMGSAPRIGMGGVPSVGLVTPPSSLRGVGAGGGGEVTQTASPQQTVKINIPQAFGAPQAIGAPLVQTGAEAEDTFPEIEEAEGAEGVEEAELLEEHGRKVPPGAQGYAPVTREQSSIRRPLLRAPYQDQVSRPTGMGMGMETGGRITGGRMLPPYSGDTSSRPVGIMPIAEFRQAPPIRFMTFGRKVKE